MSAQPDPAVFSAFVPGHPAPKGSITQGIDPRSLKRFVRESSRRVAPWVELVEQVATLAWPRRRGPLLAPVGVRCVFFLPQAKSNRDPFPTTRGSGDVDKLERAVFDGLQAAGVLADDVEVCWSQNVKLWASRERPEGVLIRAFQLSGTDWWLK